MCRRSVQSLIAPSRQGRLCGALACISGWTHCSHGNKASIRPEHRIGRWLTSAAGWIVHHSNFLAGSDSASRIRYNRCILPASRGLGKCVRLRRRGRARSGLSRTGCRATPSIKVSRTHIGDSHDGCLIGRRDCIVPEQPANACEQDNV